MVSGSAEACGIGKAVKAQHHSVNRDVQACRAGFNLRKVCQRLNFYSQVLSRFVRGNRQEGSDTETVLGQGEQQAAAAVPDVGELVHALKDVKGKKADLPIFADVCIQAPDRSSGKVPCIAVGLAVAACQGILQAIKVALMDESFAGYYMAFLVRDGKRHIPESGDIVGNEFPFISVASGGVFHKFPALINELYGQAVQLQHEQGCVFLQESRQLAHHLGLVQ